ncbi:MAG: phage tail length tape measure family protein [Rhodanobacter sp.]
MSTAGNLDIALRIKAEMDQARQQLDQLNQSLSKTGPAAKKSAADTREQTAALNELLGKIDPTIAKLDKLDRLQAKLNRAKLGGLIDDEGFARFNASIAKQRAGLETAGKAMHTFSLNSSMARLEMGRLGKDIATGQYTRFGQSFLTLANYSGVMSAAMSTTGLIIGGVTATLGLFAAAALAGEADEAKLNQAIIATGNYAGVTAGQLREMAVQTQGPLASANQALQLLVQSGKVTGDRLGEAAQGAVDLATVTGTSIEKAVAEFVKLQGDPVAAVKALDSSMHFLTLTEYENIKALQAQGDTDAAAAIAQTALSQAVHARAVEVEASLGLMERAWNRVKADAAAAWDAMKGVGRTASNTDDFNAANTKLQQIKDRLPQSKSLTDQQLLTAASSPSDPLHGAFAGDLGSIQLLIAQKTSAAAGAQWETWIAQTDARNTQIETQAKKASDVMSKYLAAAKSDEAKAAEIAAVKAATRQLIADNPVSTAQYLADEKKALAYIDKKYRPPKVSTAIQRTAESAQAQLLKLLNDEQGAVDPVAKAWSVYNDKVTLANALAAKAVKAKGANIDAIHAERDAIVAVAARVRDGVLAKAANKDRLAFEKLRDSLKDVNGVSLGRVAAQVAQLNADLAKGVITSNEYKSTLELALNQGVKKLPTYAGVSAVVGGPFGELDKLDAQEAKLQAAYKADLDLLNQQHDAKLRSDQSFVDRENALYAEHAAALKQIDDARTKVMLAGITTTFTEAASAIKQGFGAQSAAYRAAFALQKAAAIAQATVAVYTAVSKAFANGVTPVDRAIYVSQAIGEGLTIIGEIASISAGFSAGGYTGPGSQHQPAGIVHAGEVVWSQTDIARAGGVGIVEALRLGKVGYADGGFVSPLADAPRLSAFTAPRANLPSMAANDASASRPAVSLRMVNVVDPRMVHDAMSSSDGEQVILNTISRNRSTVKQVIS